MNQALKTPQPAQANLLTISWLILIFLALIWGSSFILVKKGLLAFSPMQVASIRTTAGFLALLVLALPNLRQVPREKWIYLWLSGMLGVFIPAFLFAVLRSLLRQLTNTPAQSMPNTQCSVFCSLHVCLQQGLSPPVYPHSLSHSSSPQLIPQFTPMCICSTVEGCHKAMLQLRQGEWQ